MSNRAEKYAAGLSRLIQAETVSIKKQTDKSKFYAFHQVLRTEFPTLFSDILLQLFKILLIEHFLHARH